jgi:hypothetical protein
MVLGARSGRAVVGSTAVFWFRTEPLPRVKLDANREIQVAHVAVGKDHAFSGPRARELACAGVFRCFGRGESRIPLRFHFGSNVVNSRCRIPVQFRQRAGPRGRCLKPTTRPARKLSWSVSACRSCGSGRFRRRTLNVVGCSGELRPLIRGQLGHRYWRRLLAHD